MKNIRLLLSFLLLFSIALTQNTIDGYILNEKNNLPVQDVNIVILTTQEGAASRSDGYFNIKTREKYPLNISVSHVGFEEQDLTIKDNKLLKIYLVPIVLPGEEVSVTGVYSREDQDISTSSESLSMEEMGTIGANDISDALFTLSSVNVVQGKGGIQTVSIRGSNSDEVAVYLDGIKLNDANTGIANLAAIDQKDVSSINVIKGGNTSLFGAGSFGGVVNMTTNMPDSNKFTFNRGVGTIDNDDIDFGIGGTVRLGIFGLGGRYSGKSRRYYGRSLYSTLFKNISLVAYPDESSISIKVFELNDYLQLPTKEVLQDASTQLGMVRFNGKIFNSAGWDLFFGKKMWEWYDEYYTNLNRELNDITTTSRIGKSIFLNNFDAIIQLEYETQEYRTDNNYTYDFYSYTDAGDLSRTYSNLATVLHWSSPLDHSILQQLRWEAGYRIDFVETNHRQIFELTEGADLIDLPSQIDTSITNNLSNLKFGASIFGETDNTKMDIYLNQGNSKRLPSLNDLVLWKSYNGNFEKEGLTAETQITTELGFEFIRLGVDNISQINELSFAGSVFLSNYNNKIAYEEIDESVLLPFNTDLSRIVGYDLKFNVLLLDRILNFRVSHQHINIDNPIIFPNKPKYRTTIHGSFNLNWFNLSYDHFFEGEQYVLYNGVVGTSVEKQEIANLSATLKFNVWKAKIYINYVIHNLFSSEPALADSETYYLNPYNFFDVHREIISLRLEL